MAVLQISMAVIYSIFDLKWLPHILQNGINLIGFNPLWDAGLAASNHN